MTALPALSPTDLEGVSAALGRRVNDLSERAGRVPAVATVSVTFQKGQHTTVLNPLSGGGAPAAVLVASASSGGVPAALAGVAWASNGAQLTISDLGGAEAGRSYVVSLVVIGV